MHMHVHAVHSPWLPGYIDVVHIVLHTVLLILIMAGPCISLVLVSFVFLLVMFHFICLFLRFYLFIYRDWKEGRKGENQCVVASHTCPQPRHVP